jgi:hypothetical protein
MAPTEWRPVRRGRLVVYEQGQPLGVGLHQPRRSDDRRATDRRRRLARASVQRPRQRLRRERRRHLVHGPFLRARAGLQADTPDQATTSTASTRREARRPSSPTASPSRTRSPSRQTSRSSYITDNGANQAPRSYHVDRARHIQASDALDGRRLVRERLLRGHTRVSRRAEG